MPSDIERALANFDRRLLAREREAASRMLRVYGQAWRRVQAEAFGLRQRALREPNAASLLLRAEEREAFAAMLARELRAFVDVADGETLALHRAAIGQALADAPALIEAAAGDAFLPGVRRPNPAAVQALIGYASDGSPLRELFDALTQGVPDQMADTLASGIAQGLNAREIGRQLQRQFSVPAARALLIARTETHRAYNEATMQTYRANEDILDGWIWVSACDRRSCGACFAMHGSRHRMNERLDGHPGCRCKAAPIVNGVEPPNIKPGAVRFAALPEEIQRRVLGPGRWQAWKEGALDLTATGERSIVHRRRSQQWGTMRTVKSLKAIQRG